MDLAEIIDIGAATSAALYMIVDYERRVGINKITNQLITASCSRRADNRSLDLPPKQEFLILGLDTYLAVRRYNEVYAALQEKGETTDPRELEKLVDVK